MKALFQKSKESLSHNLKQNSMKNLIKTPKGMMRIIKQNAMAVVAIGIAMGSYGLMSFGSAETQSTKKWGYDPSAPVGSQWTEVTGLVEGNQPGEYLCHSSEEICTAEFPDNVNPNSPGAPEPANQIRGDFELIED